MVCVTYTAGITGGTGPVTQPSQPSSNVGLILGLVIAAAVAVVLLGKEK